MDENQFQTQQEINMRERAQKIWTDFGPLILGAIVLLVIVGGGWYIWRSRTVAIPSTSPIPTGAVEIVEDLPSSQINLAETPSPVPSATPVVSPTPTPVVVAESKGGQPTTKGGLPATGPATNIAIFSAVLLAAGVVLRKTSKRA